MKKFIFFLFILFSFIGYSQGILWEEDFEASSLPSDWVTANVSGGNGTTDWSFGTGDFAWTDYDDWNMDNNAAIFSDYTPDETSHDNKMLLRTQGVDVSDYTNLKIKMQVSLRTSGSYGAGALSVLVYNAGSSVWQQVAYYEGDIVNSSNVQINLQTFLDAYPSIDEHDIRIAFKYDDLGQGITYGAGIGWVKITGNPPNDDCTNAVEMGTLPFSAYQHMLGATTTNVLNVCSSYDHPDGVWYTFVADHSWEVGVGVDAEWMNTNSYKIYSGSCGNLSCVDLNMEEQYYASFDAVQGTRYFINVGDPYVYNYETSNAYFNLSVQYSHPLNDACDNATAIENFPFSETISMDATTNNDGFITACSNGMNDGVWYDFVAPIDGEINISALANSFDAQIGLYMGSCTSLNCVTSVDAHVAGIEESITTNVSGGEHYFINVGHYSSSTDVQEEGDMSIEVHYSTVPNTYCTGATDMSCGEHYFGNTYQGVFDPSIDDCVYGSFDKGMWYRFSQPNGGVVSLEITYSDFYAKISVFTGDCNNLTCEFYDGTYYEFEVNPNQYYYVFVGGDQQNHGTFNLAYNCFGPENDEATGAYDIDVNPIGTTCTTPTTLWDNGGQTDSSPINGTPSCANYAGGDSWYKFIAPASGGIKINRPNAGDWGALGYAIYDDPVSTSPLVCGVISVSNTVSNPYTGLTSGNYYWLRVWEWNNNDYGSVGICLEEVDTVGFDDLVALGFTYEPNPVNDILRLQADQKIGQVRIYTMLGQEVIHKYIDNANATIDLSNLSQATYIIKVEISSKIGTFRIVKQ